MDIDRGTFVHDHSLSIINVLSENEDNGERIDRETSTDCDDVENPTPHEDERALAPSHSPTKSPNFLDVRDSSSRLKLVTGEDNQASTRLQQLAEFVKKESLLFVCLFCTFKTPDKDELKKHKADVHGSEDICESFYRDESINKTQVHGHGGSVEKKNIINGNESVQKNPNLELNNLVISNHFRDVSPTRTSSAIAKILLNKDIEVECQTVNKDRLLNAEAAEMEKSSPGPNEKDKVFQAILHEQLTAMGSQLGTVPPNLPLTPPLLPQLQQPLPQFPFLPQAPYHPYLAQLLSLSNYCNMLKERQENASKMDLLPPNLISAIDSSEEQPEDLSIHSTRRSGSSEGTPSPVPKSSFTKEPLAENDLNDRINASDSLVSNLNPNLYANNPLYLAAQKQLLQGNPTNIFQGVNMPYLLRESMNTLQSLKEAGSLPPNSGEAASSFRETMGLPNSRGPLSMAALQNSVNSLNNPLAAASALRNMNIPPKFRDSINIAAALRDSMNIQHMRDPMSVASALRERGTNMTPLLGSNGMGVPDVRWMKATEKFGKKSLGSRKARHSKGHSGQPTSTSTGETIKEEKQEQVSVEKKKASREDVKTRTPETYRNVYTETQKLELEKAFQATKFISVNEKNQLAVQLGLTKRQIKIWFQNRRAKERKNLKKLGVCTQEMINMSE